MDVKLKGKHNVHAIQGKEYLSTLRKFLGHVHVLPYFVNDAPSMK